MYDAERTAAVVLVAHVLPKRRVEPVWDHELKARLRVLARDKQCVEGAAHACAVDCRVLYLQMSASCARIFQLASARASLTVRPQCTVTTVGTSYLEGLDEARGS